MECVVYIVARTRRPDIFVAAGECCQTSHAEGFWESKGLEGWQLHAGKAGVDAKMHFTAIPTNNSIMTLFTGILPSSFP